MVSMLIFFSLRSISIFMTPISNIKVTPKQMAEFIQA